MAAIKKFLKEKKRSIINLAFALLFLVSLSVIAMLILVACDVMYFDEGIQFNSHIFDSFRSSWYGWIIFIVLQTVLSMLLCMIPGASMGFILLSKTLYPAAWQSFLLSFSSVMLASTVMYLVGRFGGHLLCEKILGKEDCDKALGLLRDKGTVFFPIMMMFPIFPDDALVMMAGTLKMSLKWFIPSIVVGRGIGIATIIFGLSIVPFDKFTSVWHWIFFILACAAFIALVFYAAIKFNRYMDSKKASVSAECESEVQDAEPCEAEAEAIGADEKTETAE